MASIPTTLFAGGGVVLLMILALVIRIILSQRRPSGSHVDALLSQRKILEASRVLVELGRNREAIDLLLEERRLAEAARIYQSSGDHARAAELFSQIGDHEAAAHSFLRCGNSSEAAKALERIHRYEQAGDLYVQAQQMKQAARMYKKARLYKKAGDLLHSLGDEKRGANLLGIHYSQAGELDKAGRYFLLAGKLKQAGETFFKAGDFLKAAQTFEKLGDNSLAARARVQAGETLATAEYLEKAGDLKGAIPLYEAAGSWRKVVELHKRQQNWAALGDIMVHLGKHDLAIEFFRRIPPQDKDYMEAAMSLASLLEKRGDVEGAIKKYSEILNSHGVNDSTSRALAALTELSERTNHPQDAAPPQGRDLAPEGPPAPEPERVVFTGEPVEQPDSKSDPGSERKDKLLKKVDQALQGKTPKKACSLLKKIVRTYPDDINSLFRLSEVYRQLGDKTRAAAVLVRAGKDYRDRGLLLQSATVYEKLLDTDATLWELRGELANLYLRSGKGTEAVAQYKLQIQALREQGRIVDSLHVVRRILALTPDALNDRVCLAEAYSRNLQYKDASREFRVVLSILEEKEEQDSLWVQVAERYMHHDMQDVQVAQQLVEKLMELDRCNHALLWLQLCFDQKPGDSENLDMLATCFESLGQPDKAVAVLKILANLYGQWGLKAEQESTMLRILECDSKDLTTNSKQDRYGPAEKPLKGRDIELDWDLPSSPENQEQPPPIPEDTGEGVEVEILEIQEADLD